MARVGDRAKPSIPPVAAGTYAAICVASIELGEQMVKYKDKTHYSNQTMYVFELPGEFVEIDGKQEPRTLSRTFTMSASEKSGLRKFVESWEAKKFTGDEFKDFDTNSQVGKAAMLGVVLSESGEYANIDTIMALPKGTSVGKPGSPFITFDIEPWDQAAFDALPEWAQERVKKSTQYQKDHPSTETIAVQAAPVATAAVVQPITTTAGGGCPI